MPSFSTVYQQLVVALSQRYRGSFSHIKYLYILQPNHCELECRYVFSASALADIHCSLCFSLSLIFLYLVFLLAFSASCCWIVCLLLWLLFSMLLKYRDHNNNQSNKSGQPITSFQNFSDWLMCLFQFIFRYKCRKGRLLNYYYYLMVVKLQTGTFLKVKSLVTITAFVIQQNDSAV